MTNTTTKGKQSTQLASYHKLKHARKRYAFTVNLERDAAFYRDFETLRKGRTVKETVRELTAEAIEGSYHA